METTFTNVFYEETQEAAQERLDKLREIDKYPEIKAYIIQIEDGSWRVLRKIKLNLTQPQSPPVVVTQPKRNKRLKTKKAGH